MATGFLCNQTDLIVSSRSITRMEPRSMLCGCHDHARLDFACLSKRECLIAHIISTERSLYLLTGMRDPEGFVIRSEDIVSNSSSPNHTAVGNSINCALRIYLFWPALYRPSNCCQRRVLSSCPLSSTMRDRGRSPGELMPQIEFVSGTDHPISRPSGLRRSTSR